MHIDWHQAYIERNSTTKAQYNLNYRYTFFEYCRLPEEQYKTLEEWGIINSQHGQAAKKEPWFLSKNSLTNSVTKESQSFDS